MVRSIWGPGDNQLLPRLQERARKGVIKLPGFNKLIDTVYIDNAAQAHLNALDALTRNPACHGKTYFISNGEPWTQGRLIAALLEASGVTAELKPVSPRLAQVAGALAEWWWQRMDRSVSSMRKMNVPASLRACSQQKSAVRAPPTWRKPVGLGAKRVRMAMENGSCICSGKGELYRGQPAQAPA